jgi:hypothetical protein
MNKSKELLSHTSTLIEDKDPINRLAQLRLALSPKTDMDRMRIAGWIKSGDIPDPKPGKGNDTIRKEILRLEQVVRSLPSNRPK